MTQLYLYIDESGAFDEALLQGEGKIRRSVVGGICSDQGETAWGSQFLELTESFNRANGTAFTYPTHFHCAPLYTGTIKNIGTLENARRVKFAENIMALVYDSAQFIFASVNPSSRFEFSHQATYGVNLIAAIRAAAGQLADSGADVTSLVIVVAQRSIGETDYGDPKYTTRLLQYVRNQVCAGLGAGPQLLRRLKDEKKLEVTSGVATVHAGLISSDFACSNVREGRLSPKDGKVVLTEPDDVIFGTYLERFDAELKHLLENRQYAAALEFQRMCMPRRFDVAAITPIMTALRSENESAVLDRELRSLLLEARALIDQRLQIHDGLVMGRDILSAIVTAAEKKLTNEKSTGLKRSWVDALTQALAEMVVCYNHVGDTGKQTEIEGRLQQVIKEHAGLISRTYHERNELLLEVKVRNLNILFNDYRFQDVVDAIQPDADARAKTIPEGETDELLGKMYGSLGQAYALMARTEPEWSELAREYFEKSIRHFEPGTLFHSMTVNYLCTLAWQEENLELAIQETQRSPNWPRISSPEALFDNFETWVTHPGLNSFDLVNLLRLCALGTEDDAGRLTREKNDQCEKLWTRKLTNEHPTEQVFKWLAYLHMLNGNNVAAAKLCDRGLAVCENLGFTVKTIGLSIRGLKAMAWNVAGDTQHSRIVVKELSDTAIALMDLSQSFANYWEANANTILSCCNGTELAKEHSRSVPRLLPFFYA